MRDATLAAPSYVSVVDNQDVSNIPTTVLFVHADESDWPNGSRRGWLRGCGRLDGACGCLAVKRNTVRTCAWILRPKATCLDANGHLAGASGCRAAKRNTVRNCGWILKPRAIFPAA